MNFLSSVKQDFCNRWKLVKDKQSPSEQRVFAGLELFCFPVSLATLFILLPLQIIASRAGWGWNPIFFQIINVLLSAAIGYITNYIAIEMLFKPYDESRLHPLSIMTFGYWKQGLIPRNKNRIGSELGHQIETKLLNPERMADELCDMVMGFIQDPAIIEKLRIAIQNMLHEHEKAILDFLTPQIENSLQAALDKILTKENVDLFWKDEIEPFLIKDENRNLIASQICSGLQKRAPQLTLIIKAELKTLCLNYLQEKLPLGLGAETISSGLVDFIDWTTIEQRLSSKIGEEETVNMLQEELQTLIIKIKDWMKSPENATRVESFIDNIKIKLREVLRTYLSTKLPATANKIMNSEQLWNWIQNSLIPAAKPQLEQLIRQEGKDKVIAKLNLSARVADSVAKQDVREFHNMINSISAQHLGAIQVLGYFLGLLIGLIQLFI